MNPLDGVYAPIFGGLDLSLRSSGMARIEDGKLFTRVYQPRTLGYTRLDDIAGAVLDEMFGCDIVAVEGLITHAKGSSLTDLAGLWWVITRELVKAKIVWVPISPPTLKKYATGKGNADKFAMFAAAMTRLGANAIGSSDEADALWCAHAAADFYGHPMVKLPAAQQGALRAVAVKGLRKGQPVVPWPVLPEGVTT